MQTFKNVMLYKALAVWSRRQLLAQQIASLNSTVPNSESTRDRGAATCLSAAVQSLQSIMAD